MSEGVERLRSGRDSAGNLVELFRVPGSQQGYPAFFLKVHFAAEGPLAARRLALLAAMVQRAQSNSLQLGTMKGREAGEVSRVLSLEHDLHTLRSLDVRRQLAEPQLVHLLRTCLEAGAVLERCLLPLPGFHIDMVKVFAREAMYADVRVENPLSSSEYLNAQAVPLLDRICALQGGGAPERWLEGPRPTAMREVEVLVEERSRLSLYQMFFALLAWVAGQPPAHFTRDEATFPHKIDSCAQSLPFSMETKELFRLVLLQPDFARVPSYAAFEAKFIEGRQPCAGEFEQRLYRAAVGLRSATGSALGLRIRRRPGSGDALAFELEESAREPQQWSTTPPAPLPSPMAEARQPLQQRLEMRQQAEAHRALQLQPRLEAQIRQAGQQGEEGRDSMFGLRVRKVSTSPRPPSRTQTFFGVPARQAPTPPPADRSRPEPAARLPPAAALIARSPAPSPRPSPTRHSRPSSIKKGGEQFRRKSVTFAE